MKQESTEVQPSAQRPSGWRLRIVLGVIALLLLTGIATGWFYFHNRSARMEGLEGTWQDNPKSQHSYQFRANGDVDAWYNNLPMGNFMKWHRDGNMINIKTERNWDFVGVLDGNEIRGKMTTRDASGATINTTDMSWRRE